MMDEPRTTEERISTSLASSTLASREDKLMPVDTLTAAGFAARRADPATLDAMHAYLGMDKNSAADLLIRAEAQAHIICDDIGVVASDGDIKFVVKKAVMHWINPICRSCEGRKYVKINGTQTLSSTKCKSCHGTGESIIPKKHNDLTVSLISWLKTIVSDHAIGTRIRMRGN